MWNSWHSFLSKIKFFTYFSLQALNGEDIPPPLWQLISKGLKKNHKPKNTDGKTCAWIRIRVLILRAPVVSITLGLLEIQCSFK